MSHQILVITGDRDSPPKHDFKYVFDLESIAFMKLHGVPEENRLKVNLGYVSAEHRANEVLDFIKAKLVPDDGGECSSATLAFFCHGLSRKIQLGFDKNNVDSLSSALREALGPDVRTITIILYACSTGALDNGFADALRDSLCRYSFVNCRVVAHTTAAHSTKNNFVKFFEGQGSVVGSSGGSWVVVPFSKPLWRPWGVALRSNTGTLRFRFPFLSISAIHSELLSNT